MRDNASMLTVALAAATRGWHVFPLRPDDKRPAVRDWEADSSSAESSDVVRTYYPEIEQIVREQLYPHQRVEVHQWSPPLRRGPQTSR